MNAPVSTTDRVLALDVLRGWAVGGWVRLSAGRLQLNESTQALCFLAGADSIFLGDQLLTTPNPEATADQALLTRLGLHRLNDSETSKV